uniref:RNA-directed DNA polymerase, eukaryota n=1 Tax=Tanacetum cinerariifolium TaxID=118510 RepID=A0A6L2KFS0_TANCI|nr:RNA-directed DNA polymerase, eukaryota [Tanacetum cinerariifolium]
MSAPFVSSLRRDVRGGEESAQLYQISDVLDTVVLSNMGDRRWVKQIPIKVNVLAWKISMDRLPTRVNLHQRRVQVSPISCPICCEALENLDHLLFCCDLAKDIARSICNWWGLVWNPVDSYRSWLSWFNLVQLQSSSKQVLEGVFYTSWWSIWSYRKHLIFSDSNLRKNGIFEDTVRRSFSWHKFNVDGSLRRYKARLVANGRSQQLSINCDETFSLVVNMATIRTVLSLEISKNWPIHQLDVKNAFLLGHLSKTIYMHQPPGFNCNPCRNHVDTDSKLGPDSDPVSYLTFYHSLADALQYLTFTHSHLSYLHVSNTDQLNTYMDPAGASLSLVIPPLAIVFFLLSWSAKRQATLSTSSTQDEYRGVANVVTESTWLRNLLCELHEPIFSATLVYCENVSVVYLSSPKSRVLLGGVVKGIGMMGVVVECQKTWGKWCSRGWREKGKE